ncbi:DUF2303 family protein [Acidisoma cellulosilytica]|uniref:DUF2303 family protein n=1 Tax=Acidisoma cellulosilyticum TaxID=2802395 RepID=A0A964E3M3_9PROT|nr:DUF2303 family protein [Acidisoma cellulosilyticum]MCB8880098.1 DUF2303 family protein [Acidisoma cellulosilyticum]
MEYDNMQAVIDAARQGTVSTQIESVGTTRWFFVPGAGSDQGRIEKIETENAGGHPHRKRGNVIVFDAASFNQVLADNADAGNIAVYFDRSPEKPSVVAILNGNGPSGPGFGDFRAHIVFRPTPQWEKWKRFDGKLLSQVDFAEFVEENLDDIAEPAGGAMLDIVTKLQAIRTVNFKSGVRLSSGEIQFQHMEDVQAQVGAGSIAVPETFTLGIAPIFGLASYAVPARFRYRIQEGRLQMGYKLQRVETMMGKIVEDVIGKIERGANISVMDGLPPG